MGEVVPGVFGRGAREGGAGPSAESIAHYPLNDFGNGMRLIVMAGGLVDRDGRVDSRNSSILYLYGRGWIGFNGVCWDVDSGDDQARKLAHVVAQKLPDIYEFLKTAVPAKDFYKWATDCGSAGKTTAMMRQAQSYLTVKIGDFDRDPFALNCPNGTLKMRWTSGVDGAPGLFKPELEKHDPADRITRVTEAIYDPQATAPLFRKVVASSMPVDEEREFLHQALGYGSTGDIREQALFWLQGPGQDGKSTILDACRETLGSYAIAASPATFLEGGPNNPSGPQPDLIALSGDTRMAIFSEPPRGSKIKEGALKAWTSGSPIQARDLQSKPINFRPIPKHFWEMNSLVVTRGDDDGIYRRIKPILFRRKIPDGEVDKLLPNKIRAEELSGVLNWLVEGVGKWLCAGGLKLPASLDAFLQDYRRASSPFGDWLTERCVIREAAGEARTLTGVLYASFKDWCESQGIDKPMSTRAFGDALNDRQIGLRGKDGKGLKFRGPIRLKTEVELAADISAANASAGVLDVASVGDTSVRGDPVDPIDDPFSWGPDR
jgi:putative DNA primase/helicase